MSGRQLLSKAASEEYGVSVSSMQKALKALNALGIIREEQTLGAIRWRLDDPFFAIWLGISQKM
jgi:hypothetical protein